MGANLERVTTVKLLWTRNPKPACVSSPATRTAPVAQSAPDPRHQPVNAPPPEGLNPVPFDSSDCTLLYSKGAAEQAAFSAHLREHPTRAGFWEHAPAADFMLDVLRGGWHLIPVAPDAPLRIFALQCVADLRGADAPGLAELKAVVERRIAGAATTRELEAVQAKTRQLVTPGGVQALPRCSPHAAGQLAVWHTADPSPYEAAFWTAEFAALHDAFVTLGEAAESWALPAGTPPGRRVELYSREHPHVRAQALRQAHERQAVRLKAILPQPFAGSIVARRLS
jgi:hypothetical protein